MEGRYVSFTCLGWESGRVLVAESFWQRFRGLMRPTDHGLLLRASSVHSFGMRHPLEVVALTGAFEVIAVGHLKPMRVLGVRGAEWVLELQPGSSTPEIGSTIVRG
jgi:uncharacterized membrane protein (UPF0127 family)